MDKPRLRDVSLQHAVLEGSPVIILKDPEHFSEKTLCIPENKAILFILSCMDGEHSLVDIQADFMRRFGTLVMSDQIRSIVNTLNENHFLDNEDFLLFRNSVMESFRTSQVISSCMAGVTYPADPEEITKLLDSILDQAGTPGIRKENRSGKKPKALIAPHIDFARGGRVYAAIYNMLASDDMPDLFLIFGTAHHPSTTLFIPTRKSFETPLGVAQTDIQILDLLETFLPSEQLYKDEFCHRGEHSIEFQALWLQHIYSGRTIPILPILCSSFEKFTNSQTSPDRDEEFSVFINALTGALQKSGKRVMVIAGADLSHVGSSFGDPFVRGLPDVFLEQVRRLDQSLVEAVCSGDAPLFFDRIATSHDRYRVCGLPPIYSLLTILPRITRTGEQAKIRGNLIDYDQSLDQERTTSVSFAGMVFYE